MDNNNKTNRRVIMVTLALIGAALGYGNDARAETPEECSSAAVKPFYQKSFDNGVEFVNRNVSESAYDGAIDEQLANIQSSYGSSSFRDELQYCSSLGLIDGILAETSSAGIWNTQAKSRVANTLASLGSASAVKSDEVTTAAVSKLDLQFTNGDVKIVVDPNATGIQVKALNGDDKIEVKKSGNSVSVREDAGWFSSSAIVEVRIPTNVAVSFNSTGGDLTISGTPQSLEANTVGGRVSIQYNSLSQGSTNIGTLSGDIDVRVPHNNQFTGKARSSKGSVTGKEHFATKADYSIVAGSQTGNITIARQ